MPDQAEQTRYGTVCDEIQHRFPEKGLESVLPPHMGMSRGIFKSTR
jgi:hypothetical protein